jgi:hypothetical protein
MASLKTIKTAFFPLCVSLAVHFAFHLRFSETADPKTRYVSRFTPL